MEPRYAVERLRTLLDTAEAGERKTVEVEVAALRALLPVICNAASTGSTRGVIDCGKPKGHEGPHYNGLVQWYG